MNIKIKDETNFLYTQKFKLRLLSQHSCSLVVRIIIANLFFIISLQETIN